MPHKFKVGQRVRLLHPIANNDRTGFGEFAEVIRQMPDDQSGNINYRIRSGQAERAVREEEIEMVG